MHDLAGPELQTMSESLRLLIVHPDARIPERVSRGVMHQNGAFEVRACRTVDEGTAVLKQGICHLVLLDGALPNEEQLKLIRSVATFSPETLILHLPKASTFGLQDADAGSQAAASDGAPSERLLAFNLTLDRLVRYLQDRARGKENQAKALKMAKELQESNLRLMEIDRKKNTCLSVATHELRTPLTIVSGYLKLLLGESLGPLNEKQAHLVMESHKNCNRLISMVGSMLDRCRLESESVEFDYQQRGYLTSVHRVIDGMRDYIQANGLSLAVDLPREEIFVSYDQDAIEQALINLIGNAVKFTPPPGKITVRCELRQDGVLTQVIDSGVGIEAEDIDSVFEEFNRVGKKYGEKKGAGLGLSICKRIISAHHGDIWVESHTGRGTCFSFLLPTPAIPIS